MINKKTINNQSTIRNPQSIYDLLVVGGGINGVGIANDAAGRGLRVALCEQHDLANGTSWKSSKLIHGGLRYLENYEFGLVRKALCEREILLKKAPHIIWPLSFVMPHDRHLRPIWLIRLGLFLYDHLSQRHVLAKSRHLDLSHDALGNPLKNIFKDGFIYWDCYADDARLVILNAMQAKQAGATILTRHKMMGAVRHSDHWEVSLKNTVTEKITTLATRILVNAGGPWVEEILNTTLNIPFKQQMELVKGSHIVVPKFYHGEHAYILQNIDKRIVFIIPFEQKYNLIGTTDVPFSGDLNQIDIDEKEIFYLCDIVNRYFNHSIKTADIVWTYAGVRPLKKDNAENLSAITRGYSFELNHDNNFAPLLSIFGGKLTTYRELAQEALALLHTYIPQAGPAWTANKPLPGGDIANADFAAFLMRFSQQYSWLPKELAYRYARHYGTCANIFLKEAKSLTDLGQHFANDLYECEVQYLIEHEFAQTAEDILWRRTKLGLSFPQAAIIKLAEYLRHSHSAIHHSQP